ncbi:MAG: glycosyltransferase, partial [Saprospiraceae bacterium]
MSRLLIITAWYHPFIHPRAHRWTAIAEYWVTQGHEVQVLTARHRDCASESEVNGVRVHRVGFDSLKEFFYFHFGSSQARGRVGNPVGPPSLTARLAAGLYRLFWKNIYFPDDAGLWYFAAREKARTLQAARPFDALISVSLPFTGHLIGLATKRRFPGLPWLADIGDPFSIQEKAPNNHWLYRRISRKLERRVLEEADVSSVTTEFTVRRYRQFFEDAVTARLKVIPPLLFPEPLPHQLASRSSSKIRIGYFGALYAPVRTPDAFLELLEDSLHHRPALREQLEIHFYGEIFPEFYARLSASPLIRLHGLQSRTAVQSAMQQMDILLNIGNQS